MEAYLDNAATTKVKPEVMDVVKIAMTEMYGNPSSLHRKGVEVEKSIKEARKIVAKAIGGKDQEIYFTSGGTESNNIAIRGMVEATRRRGNHLITTKIEHPSVLNTFQYLETKGCKVTYLDVDKRGFISLQQLEDTIAEDTVLVSIMHVNNETGSIQPIKEISQLIKRRNKEILFHIDAIQSFGKIQFNVEEIQLDGLSISGHKIHGPKGIGALYIKKGVKVKPIVTGGGHELGIRPGTENVPGIFGLGEAVKLIFTDQNQYIKNISSLKNHFYSWLDNQLEGVTFNSENNDSFAPNILNVSFSGVKSEVLLHSLEGEGVFVSSGSACSSKKRGYSHVLTAMGLKDEQIDSAIRFSFSDTNTIEQLNYALEKIEKHVSYIRKIMKR
ncbi:cysteine desulfurase [Alkaliphilus peptidifermentans DSM 18978]|uniref:Cysteine desulfurase n=1 Tax=Alkaliphilus peptidifermentans DSM 18978 TaxID=1120976 RepID=A0A1G5CGE0_9FIRM|nr:cysteine desulfurase family protein [Alkaliphilus peptidifermentans]SCY01380.1 cysteine desulfurase [Alkaliphilus peptidifermentans DSM 18978]